VPLGALTPFVAGALQDAGGPCRRDGDGHRHASMEIVVTMLWLGPEMRGRTFRAVEEA
jgi:hypothetical protein